MLLDGKGLVNVLRDQVNEVECITVKHCLDKQQSILFIDIREASETAQGYASGCELVPRGVLEMKLTGLSRYQALLEQFSDVTQIPIYLICRSGARSVLAANSLQQMGYKQVFSVIGGFLAWQEQGFSIERE